MAIKSLKELPRSSRSKRKNVPTAKQISAAKKAKPIKSKTKVIGRSRGRTEVSLGTHNKRDVAGVIKGFRQRTKSDFGSIIKDKDGQVIARTHTTRGTSTLAEQLVVKALSKYGKNYEEVTIVVTVVTDKKKKRKKK
jgi:hypothetical protein